MNREHYNKCLIPYLKGQGKTKEQRQFDMCVGAKICAKGMSEEEAKKICSLPKEPKAAQPQKSSTSTRKASGQGMRMVFLTSTGCAPCSEAKRTLQGKIDTGEIEVLNIQTNDEALSLAQKYKLYSVPKLLVLDHQGNVFSEIEAFDKAESIKL